MSTVTDCVCKPGFTEDACLDSGCRACGDDTLADPCRAGARSRRRAATSAGTFGVGGATYPEWRESGAAALPAGFRFVSADEGATEFVIVDEATGEAVEPGTSGTVTLPRGGVYFTRTRRSQREER